MQPPDYPLSCSHTDHSHLRGPDPQCGRAEGCQCGLCYGPGAAPRGPAHSHHHHLEAAAEQRTVKLQSECSPLHLDVCTPMDSVRTWALQGLPALAARQSPGKPRALKHISLRCNPQCGSAWVCSGLHFGLPQAVAGRGSFRWPVASSSPAWSLKAQLTQHFLSLAGTFPPTPANLQHLH